MLHLECDSHHPSFPTAKILGCLADAAADIAALSKVDLICKVGYVLAKVLFIFIHLVEVDTVVTASDAPARCQVGARQTAIRTVLQPVSYNEN